MKVSGSYSSLVRGVSEQVPQLRGPGQHTEQINMLPDPVTGLTRRFGSRFVAETLTGLSAGSIANYTADTATWRTFEYTNGGNEFVLLYRAGAKLTGGQTDPIIGYNKTTGQFLTYVRNVTDAQLDLLGTGGISAMTAVGKYVFMAGHTTATTATSTDTWASGANQQETVLWIRGGAYGRTFTATVTRTDNTQFTFTYKTPASSYSTPLDTSGVPVYAADPAGGTAVDTEAAYVEDGAIYSVPGFGYAKLGWAAWSPTSLSVKKGATTMTNVSPSNPATTGTQYRWDGGNSPIIFHASNIGAIDLSVTYTHTKTITNPNYAKTVTDLTNKYNSAVTKWIGDAATAIQPDAIAEQMRLAAVAAGLTTGTRIGSTVYWSNIKGIVVNDGGDGSLIRGVANEVNSIDQVSDFHKVGKVIKIRARDSAEAFYLVATAKDPIVTTGYTEVVWIEGAGTTHAITAGLLYATIVGTNLYVASSASLLTAITAGPHPAYVSSTCGDVNSSPLPFFVGKKISYLGVFQDRLMIGAGATVRASKVGDYLNFFRTSVLTVPADDPLEMLAQGSEDDVLKFSVMYDRDLVIFGEKRQYAISGRAPLTPTNPNMATISSHVNAADAPPLAVGGMMFYSKRGENLSSSSVHQIEPGLNVESPEAYLISSQLDHYIGGNVIELAQHAKPSVLFARATAQRNSLYVFHYLDTKGQGRVQDAWHRWDFDAGTGPVIGMNSTPNGLLVFTLRVAHGGVWLVADVCPLTAGLSPRPYLDSQRAWSAVAANTGSMRASTPGALSAAFDTSSEWKYLGDNIANGAALLAAYPSATGLYAGFRYTSALTPTNPFVRDRNDVAITTGQLTVQKLVVSTVKSSGFITDTTTRAGTETVTYNGRRIGDPNNILGRTPVSDLQQTLPVGRETREYSLTIRAHNWLPLTLTAIEWVGQFFSRTQRL